MQTSKVAFLFPILFYAISGSAQDYKSPFVSFLPDNQLTNTTCVTDEPPVRSQDAMGLCASFSVSALLDMEICKKKKAEDPNFNCSSLTDDQRTSTLALANYSQDLNAMEKANIDSTSRANYKKINESADSNLLLNTILEYFPRVAKESCAPFSKFNSRYWTDFDKQQLEIEKAKKIAAKAMTEASDCTDCRLKAAENIKEILPDVGSIQDIANALAQKDLPEFWYQLTLPEHCKNVKANTVYAWPRKKMSFFPESGSEVFTDKKAKFLEIMKQNFAKNRGVLISGICIAEQVPGVLSDCKDSHATVAVCTGKMCKKPNGPCKDAVRIHNSWGEDWQKNNSEGWVLADELVRRIKPRAGSLTWLEDRQ